MTDEILKSKGNSTYHFFCVKPIVKRTARNIPMLSGEKHLFNFLKNHYEKEKQISKHSNLIRLINCM